MQYGSDFWGDSVVADPSLKAMFIVGVLHLILLHSPCLSAGTPERRAGGAKVPFLNAIICFLIVNMIQRRSYKLKASNI